MPDLVRQEAANANKLAIIEKFMARLGDARQWEYDGVVLDGGKGSRAECVCGHPIRWIFVIQKIGNPSQTANVGSECINHFAEYNPDLYQRLLAGQVDLAERIKAEKKALREAAEAAANSEAGIAWAQARALGKAVVAAVRETRNWVDSETYELQRYLRLDRQFKTVRGRTNWLRAQADYITRQINRVDTVYPTLVAAVRAKHTTSA